MQAMLKRNRFGKRIRRIRKPNIAVMALATLTVILLLAWGALYWQDQSGGTAVAQGNNENDLPVIMLDLDAGQEQPQGGEQGAVPEDQEGKGGGGEAGGLLEELKNSPGGLLGLEEGWPNHPSSEQEAEGNDDDVALPTTGPEPTANGSDDAAEQHSGGTTAKPTVTPIPAPPTKPTQKPGLGPIVTDKPSSTPASTEKPAASPVPSPTTAPTPEESDNGLEHQYELELLGLQAGCIMDVKSVLKETETQVGNVEATDLVALQRIGAEAAASLEAASVVCETQFNEVAARAGQDGVSAEKIGEWGKTYNEVMEQLRAEAELKLQQMLGM
jgi:hypothetical protein